MDEVLFSMYPQKKGRLKYLLLVVGIPLLAMELIQLLLNHGILPIGKVWAYLYTFLPLLGLGALVYWMVFQKGHSLKVADGYLLETDFLRKKTRRITAAQIHSIRRNILREIILLDEDGKKILCVEAYMLNFDQFEQWLKKHKIIKENAQ